MSWRRTICFVVGIACAASVAPAQAQGAADAHRPTIGTEVARGALPSLADVQPLPVKPFPPRVIPNKVRFLPPGQAPAEAGPDPLRQTEATPTPTTAATPAPLLSFEGTSDDDNAAVIGGRVVPPDTEGDVGPNHYVQMNNLIFEIYEKDGTSVYGPAANNTLWQGLPSGSPCRENNDGDPIALYDHDAGRWVFSQFSIFEGIQCVAVSQTNDPLGAYWLYQFDISGNCLNDYPKIGVWSDAYHLTVNEFCSKDPFGFNISFRSAIAVAFEKPRMLNGQSARFVKFDVDTPAGTAFSVQPSHWEGATAPAAGRANVYAMAFDNEAWGDGTQPDGYQLWEFDVDWAASAFSFTHLGQIDTAEFDSNLCNYNACVPQPGSGENLDTLSQFTMYRLQYRSFGTYEVLVGNHTVDVGGDLAGIRWFELRNGGGGWGVHQTGTYAPGDGLHRWMGSAAMDGAGGIAVGFSASSGAEFPSVRYASRAAGDPSGTLAGGEGVCHFGSGSQINSSNRWGDYSTISLDPVDDCTFWITNEYYANTEAFDFKSRICAFKLESCGGTATCGDGTCDAGETQCSCSADCGAPPASEAGLCTDGLDNDCDALIDCADDDCSADAACAEPFCGDGTCDAGETSCNCSLDCGSPPSTETECSDGVDNDCDGLVDGDDPDCPTCTAVGDPCASDAECCTNKCRGRPGAQTCK